MSLTVLPEEALLLIVKQITLKDLIACSGVSVEWRNKFNNHRYWKIFHSKDPRSRQDYVKNTTTSLVVLPDEVLDLIVKDLNMKDLIACSGVCVGWRNRFNKDHFWKRFYSEGDAHCKGFLKNTICEVDPPFYEIPQNEERLEPVSKWRRHFMRKNRLIENWLQGCYHTTSLSRGKGVNKVLVEIDRDGTHYMIIITDREVEVWIISTISTIPQLFGVVPRPRSIVRDLTLVRIVEGKLLINFNALLIVYLLKPSFELFFKCYVYGNAILKPEQSPHFDTEIIERDFGHHYLFSNLLIVQKSERPHREDNVRFHIWDVNNKTKIPSTSYFESEMEKNDVLHTEIMKINESLGLLSVSSSTTHTMHLYDFQRLRFTGVRIEGITNKILWLGSFENIVIIRFQKSIQFYDSTSGNLITTRYNSIVRDFGLSKKCEIELVGSNLVYYDTSGLNVYDVKCLKVRYHQYEWFGSVLRDLTVIGSRFLVGWFDRMLPRMWDLKHLEKRMLFLNRGKQVDYQQESELTVVYHNSSLIKQVAYNQKTGTIHIYTYW